MATQWPGPNFFETTRVGQRHHVRHLQPAGVGALCRQLLRDRRDAMVGREGEHVVVAAHFLVERVEQIAEGVVQAQQHVLDLVAARPEVMADDVERGEADGEVVGGGALSELQRVDGRAGQPPDVRVRKRAFVPRLVEERGGLARTRLHHVRERRVPLRRRLLRDAVVHVLVVLRLAEAIPRLAEVVQDGMGIEVSRERRLRRLAVRRRRAEPATLDPQHDVALLPREHRRRGALQGQRDHAALAVRGLAQRAGEGRHFQQARAAAGSPLTVAVEGHFLRRRVRAAGDRAAASRGPTTGC